MRATASYRGSFDHASEAKRRSLIGSAAGDAAPGISAVHGAASVFSASSCNAVMSATALVHGAVAAVIAFAVSAMCRSGHITCSVDISSVSQRVGSGVGWDIASLLGSRVDLRSCSASPVDA